MGQQFAKSVNSLGGQCPVKHYNRELMRLILNRKIPKLTATLNIQVIELGGAPKAYEIFNSGKPVKYVIDPHGITKAILKGEWVNEFEAMRGKDALMKRREEAEMKAMEEMEEKDRKEREDKDTKEGKGEEQQMKDLEKDVEKRNQASIMDWAKERLQFGKDALGSMWGGSDAQEEKSLSKEAASKEAAAKPAPEKKP